MKRWTHDEENMLLDLKGSGSSLNEIAEILGRSYEAVKSRSKRLRARQGENKNVNWSDEEIEILRKDYTFEELVNILGRTKRSIQSKCENLGISKRDLRSGVSGTGTMDKSKPAILYLADFGDFKKVGVTQSTLEDRFKQDKNYTLLDTCEMSLDDALHMEYEILKNMRAYRVKGDIRRGFYECFNYPSCSLEDLL